MTGSAHGRSNVRDDNQTTASPAHRTYFIPPPTRRYTTTNPNTHSPTYHLLYDLTRKPGVPPTPDSSIQYDSHQLQSNPLFIQAKPPPSPPHGSNETTLRGSVVGRQSYLDTESRASVHVETSKHNSGGFNVSDSQTHLEKILSEENLHCRSDRPDVTDQLKGSKSRGSAESRVTGVKCDQTEVNKRREEIDNNQRPDQSSSRHHTANISAKSQPHKSGLALSSQNKSRTSERVKTSDEFNETEVGFPPTGSVAGEFVVADISEYNNEAGDSAAHHTQITGNGTQLSSLTGLSVQNVVPWCSGGLIGVNSKELHRVGDTEYNARETLHSINSEHCLNTLNFELSQVNKRAVFKRDGDSVRLFLVQRDEDLNNDSGVVSDNETLTGVVSDNETLIGVDNSPVIINKEERKSTASGLSLLPGFLRTSLRGKSKKKSRVELTTHNNNITGQRSKVHQFNRWHNLQLHSSIHGQTADNQRETKKGESGFPPPVDLRVINTSSSVGDPAFYRPSSAHENKETLHNTGSPWIKGILVNKGAISRHVHKASTVQFIDQQNSIDQRHCDIPTSKTRGSQQEIIDRNKYIIRPREIVVDTQTRGGYAPLPSPQALDNHRSLTDQSISWSLTPRDSSAVGHSVNGNNNWLGEHLISPSFKDHSSDSLSHCDDVRLSSSAYIPVHQTHVSTSDCTISTKISLHNLSTRVLDSDATESSCTINKGVYQYSADNHEPVKLSHQQVHTSNNPLTSHWSYRVNSIGQSEIEESKITLRQKFERHRNLGTSLRNKILAYSTATDNNHKESPRARFERDRAARTHAIASSIDRKVAASSSIDRKVAASSSIDRKVAASSSIDRKVAASSSIDRKVAASSSIDRKVAASSSIDRKVAASSCIDRKVAASSSIDRKVAASGSVDWIDSNNSTFPSPKSCQKYLQDSVFTSSSPPPLPPRVRCLTRSPPKTSDTDLNGNFVAVTAVASSQSLQDSVNTPLAQKDSIPDADCDTTTVSRVEKQLHHQVVSAGFEPIRPSANSEIHINQPIYSHRNKELNSPETSPGSLIRSNVFNISDIVSQNEYIRQVLNQSTVQQLRFLFGEEYDDLSSLTSQNSSVLENVSCAPFVFHTREGGDTATVSKVIQDKTSESFSNTQHIANERFQQILLANPSVQSTLVIDSITRLTPQNTIGGEQHLKDKKTLKQPINVGLESSTCSIVSSHRNKYIETNNRSGLAGKDLRFPGNAQTTLPQTDMLASKGLRIYDSVEDYVAMVRSPIHKSLSAPQMTREGHTYLIVPTVLEDEVDKTARGKVDTAKLSQINLIDFVTPTHDRATFVPCQNDSDTSVTVSDDTATYITMTSSVDRSLTAGHRAMSVEVLCASGKESFHRADPIRAPSRADPNRAPRTNPLDTGYVEWRTCSGWVGQTDLRPTVDQRNSRGYVEWDTLWSQTPVVKTKDDDHVYDVIGDYPSPNLVAAEADKLPNDTPPALPERTYIHRLRPSTHHNVSHDLRGPGDSASGPTGRHGHSSCHCPSYGRKHHHHHHHRHNHHNHSKAHTRPPPIPPTLRALAPSTLQEHMNLTNMTDSVGHQEHMNLTKLTEPSSPVTHLPDTGYNYAEVNKLRGYTFSNTVHPTDPPPKSHRFEHSAISSENYCRLAPETSADSMTSWQSGDLLDFIDGLHDSMSAKRRENIYILLNNKKTRAKFSESLEIESRLLSRGLISTSTVVSQTPSVSSESDTRERAAGSKPGLIRRKGAIAPVSSTYV